MCSDARAQRPSTSHPVLIAFIQEDTPGPSSAVGHQMQDQDEQEDEGQLEPRVGEKNKKFFK